MTAKEQNEKYEKLYDKISNLACEINEFRLTSLCNEPTEEEITLLRKLSDKMEDFKNVAHELEEYLAWEK